MTIPDLLSSLDNTTVVLISILGGAVMGGVMGALAILPLLGLKAMRSPSTAVAVTDKGAGKPVSKSAAKVAPLTVVQSGPLPIRPAGMSLLARARQRFAETMRRRRLPVLVPVTASAPRVGASCAAEEMRKPAPLVQAAEILDSSLTLLISLRRDDIGRYGAMRDDVLRRLGAVFAVEEMRGEPFPEAARGELVVEPGSGESDPADPPKPPTIRRKR